MTPDRREGRGRLSSIEAAARAMAAHQYPDCRWPEDANDLVDTREDPRPVLTWDYAENMRAFAAVALAAASPTDGPNYKAGWKALSEPLSWMQGHEGLKAYWGWNLAEIANDLIDRAYPGLRAGSVQS